MAVQSMREFGVPHYFGAGQGGRGSGATTSTSSCGCAATCSMRCSALLTLGRSPDLSAHATGENTLGKPAGRSGRRYPSVVATAATS